jgi:hypothetical protein
MSKPVEKSDQTITVSSSQWVALETQHGSPEWYVEIAGKVNAAYSQLQKDSLSPDGKKTNLTITWRARELLRAYDALVAIAHDKGWVPPKFEVRALVNKTAVVKKKRRK